MQNIDIENCLIVDDEVIRTGDWVEIEKTDNTTILGMVDDLNLFSSDTENDCIELILSNDSDVTIDIDDIKRINKVG